MTTKMTSMNFLNARQQGIRLLPTSRQTNVGYVWRRVFLKEDRRG